MVVDDGGMAGVVSRAWGRELSQIYGASMRVVDREAAPVDAMQVAGEAIEDDDELVVLSGASPMETLVLAERSGVKVLLARELPPPVRVLAAIDGSPASAEATRVGVDLADRWELRIDVLHVFADLIEPPSLPLNANHASVQALLGGGADVHSVAAASDPARVIIESAGRSENALIVMGRRASRGRRDRSVSEHVVREARCSVLVVPSSPLL